MYRPEDHEIISLFGSRVRVRRGIHTFEGVLQGPSQKKFERGPNRMAYGVVLNGDDFQLEFAWWDWKVQPLGKLVQSLAAEQL